MGVMLTSDEKAPGEVTPTPEVRIPPAPRDWEQTSQAEGSEQKSGESRVLMPQTACTATDEVADRGRRATNGEYARNRGTPARYPC